MGSGVGFGSPVARQLAEAEAALLMRAARRSTRRASSGWRSSRKWIEASGISTSSTLLAALAVASLVACGVLPRCATALRLGLGLGLGLGFLSLTLALTLGLGLGFLPNPNPNPDPNPNLRDGSLAEVVAVAERARDAVPLE